MDLRLTENQQVLVESARRFFGRAYPLERMREIYLLSDTFNLSLWTDIRELGWNAAALPESIGAFEGGLVEAMLLLIEMGRAGCLTPFPHSTVASALALSQSHPSLAQAIANSTATIIPVPQPLLQDASALANSKLTTTAGPVPWAALATHFLVEFDNQALLVASDQETVEVLPLASSRGEPISHIHFTAAKVENLGASKLLFSLVRDYGAFACSAMMQGICERALELAVEYAKERIQFGRPIGSFQAIQHKAADMRIATDVGRVLVLRASAEKDQAKFRIAAARAKAWTSDAARRVTRDAMQIFGGISFAGDHPIQLFYQSVITLANHYGAAHDHRATLAAALLD